MKKLYNLCKQYGIEITMTDATYGDSVSFRFYDKKTNKGFCQIVTDEMIDSLNVSFEDFLCNKVIEELKLDKDLWTRTVELFIEKNKPDCILRTCKRCNGIGYIVDLDSYSVNYSACPECNGEGKIKIGYR